MTLTEAVPTDVATPVMVPVDALMLSPAGKPVAEKTNGDVPPEAKHCCWNRIPTKGSAFCLHERDTGAEAILMVIDWGVEVLRTGVAESDATIVKVTVP
jgi:hypothetical protein